MAAEGEANGILVAQAAAETAAIGVVLAPIVILIGCPASHLIRTVSIDSNELRPLPPGRVDDASRLDETSVAEVWAMPSDDVEAERQLRSLLERARKEGLRVSIAGARHSMGGQTIYADGVQIDMARHNQMQLDPQANILHVQAGALWSQVVPYLDRQGRSVAVMQSNNSFSVGGSLSVNCHGWQNDRPPIASTVESFRVMTVDGKVLRCSRNENSELFSLVLGGYGLFGVILDADLHVVANERYRLRQLVLPSDTFIATWDKKVGRSKRRWNGDGPIVRRARRFFERIDSLRLSSRTARLGTASGPHGTEACGTDSRDFPRFGEKRLWQETSLDGRTRSLETPARNSVFTEPITQRARRSAGQSLPRVDRHSARILRAARSLRQFSGNACRA